MPTTIFVALARTQDRFDNFFPRGFVSMKLDWFYVRSPTGQFFHPIAEGTFRHYNQMGSVAVLIFLHVYQNGEGLQGFP